MPVRIEHEHLVVTLDVLVLLGRKVNASADLATAAVRSVNLSPSIDVEGEVLKADLVVPVTSAISGSQPQVLLALPKAEIDHLLGAAVRGEPFPLTQSQRPEHRQVESQRAFHVANRKVNVMNPKSA